VSTFSQQVRGRGARSNATGRYEALVREAFDDGWTPDDVEPHQLKTTLHVEKARKIITTNDSPDVGFSRSINPYRGCEHGCIYCYARPAHAYMGLSPGLDFESELFFKPDAAALLEKELSSPRYRPEFIHIGGNTDPYQPIEKTTPHHPQRAGGAGAVRSSLLHHPKSALILRDLDILSALGRRNLCRVAISVTSLDRKLARSMEPRACDARTPDCAIKALADAGVPVSVMFAPAHDPGPQRSRDGIGAGTGGGGRAPRAPAMP
jgi:DNA repair photolyase